VAVSTSVTKSLAFLCADENAGPVKLMKAKAQGIVIFMPQKEKVGEHAVHRAGGSLPLCC
jgi:NAD-dependent DNA ligase